MINAISAADIAFIMSKFTSYCELIEWSRPIRFFIVSLMYNNKGYSNSVDFLSRVLSAPKLELPPFEHVSYLDIRIKQIVCNIVFVYGL